MMASKETFCGIVILAAGNSSRLGEPKQLLRFNGKSLIRHVSEEALTVSQSVVVVTGAYKDQILNELTGLPVRPVHNPDWQAGMGGSLAIGLKELISLCPGTAGVIICVSDQPHISQDILRQLYEGAISHGTGITACSYGATLGTPAFFSRDYFEELLNLSGAAGARYLLSKYKNDVTPVPFPLGHIDIDTREDYHALTGN